MSQLQKTILENIRIILIAMCFSLGLGIAFAWTDPTTVPPPTGTNVPAPINASAAGQVKQGNLIITNSAGLANGLIVVNGKVGLGTTGPAAKLEVAGPIKIANDADVCTSIKAGTIKWTGSVFQGCNGTTWIPLSSK